MKLNKIFSKNKMPILTEKEILINDLNRIQRQIYQVNLLFNLADDPELIDSYIYELKSLRNQYNFLLASYRENEKKQLIV